MNAPVEEVVYIVPILDSTDVLKARQSARELAARLKLGSADQTRLATAVSELTRNVLQYAGQGQCKIIDASSDTQTRITVVVEDHGPGIPDIELAMRDGYSTSGGLGAGLPGVQRLMDEFHLISQSGHTCLTITMSRPRLAL
ncbi:MAG: anti-sigma regulatory factor [Gammaproteobacteria bacterium]|nr:anti-sigma regulatory factor [Gammaproteobacteria bacterium]MCP5195360.1 anti-sigma regulatory factor [Gammaproteobacteria bacterium]